MCTTLFLYSSLANTVYTTAILLDRDIHSTLKVANSVVQMVNVAWNSTNLYISAIISFFILWHVVLLQVYTLCLAGTSNYRLSSYINVTGPKLMMKNNLLPSQYLSEHSLVWQGDVWIVPDYSITTNNGKSSLAPRYYSYWTGNNELVLLLMMALSRQFT